MATTVIVSQPALKQDIPEPAAVLQHAYDGYAEDTRNNDKAGSMEDASYYQGRIDAFAEVIFLLTGRSI